MDVGGSFLDELVRIFSLIQPILGIISGLVSQGLQVLSIFLDLVLGFV